MTSLSLFVVLFTVLFKSEAAVPEDCDLISTTTIPVYYNWPVSLNCDDFLWGVLYDDIYDNGTQSIIFNCTITALPSGDVVLQSSTEVSYDEEYYEYLHPDRDAFIFTMDEVTISTQTTYEMNLTYQVSGESDVVCNARKIILNATDLVQQTCDENLLIAESIDMVHNIRGKEVGDKASVLCDVLSTFPGPKKLVDEDKAETHWLYNCGSELPSNTAEDHRHKHGLLLTNISYEENPGVYTCVVEYGDQIRYRIHHRICVKDRVSRELTLSCPDYKAIVGQDVEIECHVDAGLGHENELFFDSHFHKLDGGSRDINVENSSCGAFADRNDTIVNDRFSCSLVTSHIGDIKCFSNPPTEEEYQSQKTFLKMSYKIKNVQASDFGVYVATMLRLQHAFNTTFTLEEDLVPTLKRSTLAIAISISVLVGIGIIVFLLIYFYRLKMRSFWKRHLGPTEKGDSAHNGHDGGKGHQKGGFHNTRA